MMLGVIVTLFCVIFLFRFFLRCLVLHYKSNVDMTGKVVIVTGANSGIGYYIAKGMAERGARVILACRSESRGCAARDQIIAETGNKDVVFKNMDLASLSSVRAFCEDTKTNEQRLDVLVNNAGVFGFGNRVTEDNLVEGMQINHFGPFLLTELLLPLLKRNPSRIIFVSSLLHYIGNFKVDYFNKKGYYTDLLTYSNSKMCSMAYAVELANKLKGSGVVVNSVHPGTIKTPISDKVAKDNVANVLSYVAYCVLCWVCQRSAEEGAGPVLQACLDPALSLVTGKFLVDGAQWPYSWRCSNRMVRVSLWRTSEEYTFKKESVANGYQR